MSKAGARYLNMFVPPWGRFDRGFDVMLRRAGILSFSGNATSPRHDVPLQHDCHILTEHGKAALALEVVLGRATRHLEIRRTGILPRLQPIGVMTHHRMFTPELDAVLEEFLEIVQTAGLRFSDFAVIDAAMNRTEAPVVSHSRPPSGAPASTRAAAAAQPVSQSLRALSQQLLAPTLPSVAAGLIGLPQVLSELARTSPISALRYAHLVELVAALPAGSRVLSAGCGKGLSELALAIGFPEVTWVGVDVDSTRYRNAQELGRSVDATSISFVQADLDQLDSAALGQFDAIMVSEVAMYLREPARVLKELASLLRPGGVLTCIEPFVADSDPTVLEKLRQHTQSIHGGFSHEQMASFVDGLTLVHHGNAYYGESFTLVHQLWDHMSATQNWGLVDLLFALARLDLDGSKVDSRRDATAVKVVARRDA
jgi:SAM-dependent methyltransferase